MLEQMVHKTYMYNQLLLHLHLLVGFGL
jgi:hypothetical protein